MSIIYVCDGCGARVQSNRHGGKPHDWETYENSDDDGGDWFAGHACRKPECRDRVRLTFRRPAPLPF